MCYTLGLLEPLSPRKDNLDVGLDGVSGAGSSGTQPGAHRDQWGPVQLMNEVLMAPSARPMCGPGEDPVCSWEPLKGRSHLPHPPEGSDFEQVLAGPQRVPLMSLCPGLLRMPES